MPECRYSTVPPVPTTIVNSDLAVKLVSLLSIFLYRVLTQVWCNLKSQKAAKAFGFNKITTGVLLLSNIDSQNPQNVD
jgi:hypothetical protein